MRARFLHGALAAAAITVLAISATGRQPPGAGAPPPARAPFSGDFKLAGAPSCSAQACHGSADPLNPHGLARNEFTAWTQGGDKHARAYQVLFNARSQNIAKNLGIAKAHESARCLACHTNPQAVAQGGDTLAAELRYGIGCESCHGPAEKWLAPHTDPTKWKALAAADKKATYGMNDQGDLLTMARACAGCHVGAPATPQGLPLRDVNHDLIAAGHPRLKFEFASYFANMPPHWGAARETARPASFDLTALVTGQVAQVEAVMDLVAERARKGANEFGAPRPWPEFAEYDCYACHHDFQGDSWRQKLGYGARMPGALPWGSWSIPTARALASEKVEGLDDFQKLLQQPYPDPAKVREQAARVKKNLVAQLAKAAQAPAPELEKRVLPLITNDAANLFTVPKHEDVARGWDAAAQLYLLAAVLHQNQGGKNAALGKALDDMARGLRFPTADPAAPSPWLYDSPQSFNPEKFRDSLRAVRQALKPN